MLSSFLNETKLLEFTLRYLMFILKLFNFNIERDKLIARIHTLIRKIVFYGRVYKSNIKKFLYIFILNG